MTGNLPASTERDITRINAGVRDLFFGRSNAMGSFTLTPSVTTTTVTAPNIGSQSVISLTPFTASAAAAVTSVYIDPATVKPGQFIVTHNSDAAVDRTFGYAITG